MTPRSPLRLGVWQDETPSGGLDAALTRISEALKEARDNAVEILVFPECFLTGYFRPADEVPAIAAGVDAKARETLANLAKTTGVGFVLGAYEETDAGIANAAHVFLPSSSAPVTYRKRALYGDWEKSVFRSGDKPLLFRHCGHTFAVLICFDVEFPELVREAAQLGAEVVLVPTALMEPDHWVTDFMIPSRAIENGVTIAYANRVGREGDLTFIGKSQICDALAQSRRVAADGSRGLIDCLHEPVRIPSDYLAEIEAQKLPRVVS